MRDAKNQHASSIHIWLSETQHLLPVLVILFISTTEVASVYCREDSSSLTMDCAYIKAEGILCTWDWKNLTAVGFQGGRNITATVVLNNSVGIAPETCIDQDANTTCRFQNQFDAITMFFVTAIVNNSRAEEVYEICKAYTLLTTVRYEKPRNITFYHRWWGIWETDVVWQFPSDYPTSQGVMKTWSICKVRWSEDLKPWKERQVRSNNYMSIDDLRPLSTYNVQVTCLCMYSRRENWTSNETFTTAAKIDGIDHDPALTVSPTQSTTSCFRTVSMVTESQDTSEKSSLKSSTKNMSLLPTTITAISINVTDLATSNGSGAALALGVIGAIILLSAALIGGLIFTCRYRKTPQEDNRPPRMAEDLTGQSAEISRCLSKEKLLDNASHRDCNRTPRESVL